MTTKYTVDYFIQKFEAIPDELWCVDKFENERGQRCVLGHCGRNSENKFQPTEESWELDKLIFRIHSCAFEPVACINNGTCLNYPQPTPKARILAALKDVKERAK